MKIISLLTTSLFALSVAGSVHAASVDVPPTSHETPAAAQCVSSATDGCPQQAADAAPAQAAHGNARVDEAPLPVAEPETFVMLMLGLVALGVTTRRRSSERFDH